MSDIEQVVIRTRKLEALLKEQYHAEGQGLHQLITSCERRLPHELIPTLRYIATVRNKLLHEDGYVLDDSRQFFKQSDWCIKALTPRAARFIWRTAWSMVLLITVGSLIFYYWNWDSLILDMFE